MPEITYSIINNSTNTTATINYITIDTNTAQIQHYLNLSGWNEPWNTSYTNFTGESTLRSFNKTYVNDISPLNGVVADYYSTGTNYYIIFSNNVSEVDPGWSVTPIPGGVFTSPGVTVAATSGTNWVRFSDIWDNIPQVGDPVTMAPPENLLEVNNTTGLEVGWFASGNGYAGQSIERIDLPDTLKMSGPPTGTPVPGGTISFTSNEDEMLEIPPLTSSTFIMNYTNVTSSLGTYISQVDLYATQGSTVQKTINNYLLVSSAPVTDPVSPFYDPSYVGGDAGGADPGDCSDAAATDAACDAAAAGASGGGGGAGCFIGSTLVTMSDGSKKRISDIEIGDLVLDARDPSQHNRVIGIKTMLSPLGKYLFSPFDNVAPFMTEEHPYFDDNGNLCAISDLAEDLAPWLGSIRIVDVPNKFILNAPIPVYNLFLEQGNSHFANDMPVSNIVGHGNSYVLYYLGHIDFGTYVSHARNADILSLTKEQRIFYYKIQERIGNYILTHDNLISKFLCRIGVAHIKTHRDLARKIWNTISTSLIGKLVLKHL